MMGCKVEDRGKRVSDLVSAFFSVINKAQKQSKLINKSDKEFISVVERVGIHNTQRHKQKTHRHTVTM